MIKRKHLPIIETEARQHLKKSTLTYTRKSKRKTFPVRVLVDFKPKIKEEASKKTTTMSKVFDEILLQRYPNYKKLDKDEVDLLTNIIQVMQNRKANKI